MKRVANTKMLCFSRKLRHIPFLRQLLMPDCQGPCVLGWGHKPTANKARRYAAAQHLPYIALEDGFLRSLDLGYAGNQPLSLIADHTGIYYDAGSPSDVENILNATGWETPEILDAARHAIRKIRHHGLSKYNHAPDAPACLWEDCAAPHVLLLDQTMDDASVNLGLANTATFRTMLDTALENYSPENIRIKIHPDVLAGKTQGYLLEYAKAKGVNVIATDYAPLSLLAQADVVYTVTSQMGFEALMLDKEVHCFGMPFYAGWGLTQDMQACPRRKKQRSFEEVFAAAYLLYARYIHPIRGERCDIQDVINLLIEQRRQNERNRRFHACLGFRWWKRPYARAYLHCARRDNIQFFWNVKHAILAAQARNGELVAWSSNVHTALQQECDKAGVTLTRMEDGFIRSVGLGSNFNWPYSLVLDRKGIYYDPSQPSDLEDMLNAMPTHPDRTALLQRAAALRSLILEKELTKYNTGSHTAPVTFPVEKKLVLVPGQVEDDASVRCGGFGMANLDLLRAARDARPDAFIIYKPHPDVENGNRLGVIAEAEALRYADCILRDFPMGRLLPHIHEVHTLTSQTGFEALLRGVKVFTYGGPFYAGWGLTEDKQHFPRRNAHLSLDELVAGTLLLYPSYYDWQTESFCRVEDVCCRLLQPHGQMRGRIWGGIIHCLRSLLIKRYKLWPWRKKTSLMSL